MFGIALYQQFNDMIREVCVFILLLFLSGCAAEQRLKTEILTPVCIKPLYDYHYKTCNKIVFKINEREFYIPAQFETDLASIPRIAWPIMAPAHSSLIRPAIIHDWLYRKTCDFSRFQTDLIFYHMLRNDGISIFQANMMYFAVRLFGWNYYNEDYCDEELKGMDKEARSVQIAFLFGYSGKTDDRLWEEH